MGFREQIGNLFAGADVPVGYAMLLHLVLGPFWKPPALSDRLHDLEGPLFLHAAGDEIEHDIVPAADGLANGSSAGQDQVPGVAQPHIGAVRETGQPHQNVEFGGLGLLQHAPDEGGAELRNGGGSGRAENRVVLVPQCLRGNEDTPGIRIVQRDGLGVHAAEVLHHADHGGIIVAQHVQLEQIGLHGVIFEMGGDNVGIRVIGRVLHRAEIVDLLVLGDDHHAAGVLSGGPFDPGTALGQPQHLRLGGGLASFLQVLFYVAEGGLFRYRADGARPEHVGLSKELKGMAVGAGLVLAGEVQVDIGHLVAAEAQEGLEGDVEAVFFVGSPAHGAHRVGHIGSTAPAPFLGRFEVGMLAVGAAVVGRQGVDLGDARQKGHDRGPHRAPGAHQIAMVQGVLHQLLGRHVNHVIMPHQDISQLGVDAIHYDLGRLLPVKALGLSPHQPLQLPLGILQLGGEQTVGQRVQISAPGGDELGIVDDHLPGGLSAQIGEFLQHLVGGAEVKRIGRVGVLKALGGQQHMAVDLVLRVQEVDVAGGHHGFAQFMGQLHDGAVEIPQLLPITCNGLAVLVGPEHIGVVAQRLNFQIVVPGGDALELRPGAVPHHCLEQLARLTGRAHQQPLPVLINEAFGHHRILLALEVLQMSLGDQLIEIAQAGLVAGQDDEMPGPAFALPGLVLSGDPAVDGPQGVDIVFLLQPFKEGHQHIGHGGGVVGGSVVVEGGQAQVVGHDVQLVLGQVGQKGLGQRQGVHRRRLEGDTAAAAALRKKPHVKAGIVGRQRPPVDKGQKLPDGLRLLGRALDHLVGNAGQTDDLGVHGPFRVHKGGKDLVGDLAVLQHYRTDLRNHVPLGVQAGGL